MFLHGYRRTIVSDTSLLAALLTVAIMFLQNDETWATDDPPKKYALLVAVDKYDAHGMNLPQPLEFAESDARAVEAVLRASGYTSKVLAGPQATKKQVDEALSNLKLQGNDAGAVVVAFFGHGVELTVSRNGKNLEESFFCPWDVTLRDRRDANNNVVPGADGKPLIEPDSTSCVGMTDVFHALKLTKAGRRILITDCCRRDPNAARGGSFGANIATGDLPPGTAWLLSCSSGERAFEHRSLGHGVFTKALLDRIKQHQTAEPLPAHVLGADLKKAVPELLRKLNNGAERQTPTWMSVDTVDLLLSPSNVPIPPLQTAPFAADTAKETQQSWATHLKIEQEVINQVGMRLIFIPPGNSRMGSLETELERDVNEAVKSIQIRTAYYLGACEVTVREYSSVMDRLGAQNGPKRGHNTPDLPASNVSWEMATQFCNRLSELPEEIKAKRRYRLPTEMEWEYACRAGTLSPFHCGERLAVDDGHFALANQPPSGSRPVASGRPNAWGLFDMHGNVREWCSDTASNPFINASSMNQVPTISTERVLRGGSWLSRAGDCRSAARLSAKPTKRTTMDGFRVLCELIRVD